MSSHLERMDVLLSRAEYRELQEEMESLRTALTTAERERDEARRERDQARGDVNRWIQAALAATMPDEFGLAFDPTNPEGWAFSRRSLLERLLTRAERAERVVEAACAWDDAWYVGSVADIGTGPSALERTVPQLRVLEDAVRRYREGV